MTTGTIQPSPGSSRRRVQRAALALVLMMAIAAIGLVALGTRAVTLNTTVDRLTTRQEDLTAEIRRMENDRKTLEGELAALEERRVQLQAEIAVLNTTLGYVRKANPQATAAAETRAELIPRVYIQVASAENAKQAEALAGRLRQAGFVVPRIERVRAVPRQPQIRYFSADAKAQAERVLALVTRELPNATVVFFSPSDTPRASRPGHIELWF